MAIKTVRRSISINKLRSIDSLNVRVHYDLETLEPQVISKGRITDPLTVEPVPGEPGYYNVLRGNRRVRVAQKLRNDPTVSQELKDALAHLDCEVIDQAITERERLEIIIDQGTSKGLNREETVRAVWRLDGQMMSESAIGELLFYQLAQYTGNLKKLAELSALKDPIKRRKFLGTWFKGTLGQKLLLANHLGDYVRAQFLLTTQAEDGKLPEGQTVECAMSQERLKALNAARIADQAADGWDVVDGGETFNKLLQEYRDVDAGRASKEKTTRPTAAKLLDYANTTFKSAPVRAVLKVAAGEGEAGAALQEMDAAIYRWSLASEILAKNVARVQDENVRNLILALISDKEAALVETALVPFFTVAEPVTEPVTEPVAEPVSNPEPVTTSNGQTEPEPEPVTEPVTEPVGAVDPVSEEAAANDHAVSTSNRGRGRKRS